MFSRFLKTIMLVSLVSFGGTLDSLALNQLLIVKLSTGKSVKINLGDNPKTSFTDTDLVIETDKLNLSYPRETVISFKYENAQTNIVEAVSDGNIIIDFKNDIITIANLRQDEVVKLIAIDGVIMTSVKANTEGIANIATSDFQPGIYIVNTGSINHKLYVR